MEFWGVEIKVGETLKVQPGDEKLLHLSQAALGESRKGTGTDSIHVFVKVGDQKLVIGSLSSASFPQLAFDLVFEKEFELSHNWKNGSVHFTGYKNVVGDDDGDDYSEFSGESSDEDMPLVAEENGKSEKQVPKAKETAAKAKVKVVEPVIDDEDESDDDLDSEDIDSDEEIDGDEDDSEDDEDSEEEEETPTPKKAVGNKKRQAESATKTPVPAKKAKAASPQKTDGKKGAHTGTPHPAKNASKTPNTDKSKSPKSGGDVTCKSCSKGFKSEQAMEAHSKAKHSAGK